LPPVPGELPAEGQLPPVPGELPAVVQLPPVSKKPDKLTPTGEVLPPGKSALPGKKGSPKSQPLVYEQINPVFLPPELSVSRGDILTQTLDDFSVQLTKKDLIKSMLNHQKESLSIFLSVTNYRGVVLAKNDSNMVADVGKANIFSQLASFGLKKAKAAQMFDLGKLQLYPDVPPELPGSYAINISTMLGDVQGYYQEKNSPFKPNQPITRVEAVKVIMGAVDGVNWLYYEELQSILGGTVGIRAQKTPFTDVDASVDYMWWIPRYLNKACDMKIITCEEGSRFRPEAYISDSEILAMVANMKNYLNSSTYLADQTGDPDGDNLPTYLEETVYYTNPLKADTDGDGLRDDEEIRAFMTSPFVKDSDADGLDDYQEAKVHKTNPLNPDTDGDGFGDFDEVRQGTDPLDPDSYPSDSNTNQVADTWEAQYKVDVVDGEQDTDRDGLTDKLEYQYGTDPVTVDSDNDGFSDAEEILTLKTDPNNPDDPGKVSEIGVKITSFEENQLVGDNTPLIKGVAPFGYTVRIVLRNEYGNEKVLGDAFVDQNGVFLFQVENPIRDGKYMLVAKSLQVDERKIIVSSPVKIRIDSSLNVTPPKPTRLSDQQISEDVILKNLRVEIRDRRPVLVGETEFGNKVTATWRSVVMTSALIADAVGGEFSIESPTDLEVGQHEIYVQATRKKDNAQSDTVKVLFNVGVSLPGVEGETLKPSAAEAQKAGEVPVFGAIFGGVVAAVETGGIGFWIMLFIILAIVGGAVYCKVKGGK